MEVQEVGWQIIYLLIWLRIETLANAVLDHRVAQNGGNLMTNLEMARFPRRTLPAKFTTHQFIILCP